MVMEREWPWEEEMERVETVDPKVLWAQWGQVELH